MFCAGLGFAFSGDVAGVSSGELTVFLKLERCMDPPLACFFFFWAPNADLNYFYYCVSCNKNLIQTGLNKKGN